MFALQLHAAGDGWFDVALKLGRWQRHFACSDTFNDPVCEAIEVLQNKQTDVRFFEEPGLCVVRFVSASPKLVHISVSEGQSEDDSSQKVIAMETVHEDAVRTALLSCLQNTFAVGSQQGIEDLPVQAWLRFLDHDNDRDALPPPWQTSIQTRACDEARREIGPTHPLWHRRLAPYAHNSDSGEVLFSVLDGPHLYALMQLTWSGRREASAQVPAQLFGSYHDVCRFLMQR